MSVSEFEKRLVAVLKANCHRYQDENSLLDEQGLRQVMDTCTECGHDLDRAIELLRFQGYEIDGDDIRGWCLIKIPDTLNYLEIESGLTTTFLGRSLFTYSMIGSTNDTARMLAEAGAADGSLLVAEEQSKGRGRFDNTWYSPPGTGIWASLILRPGINPLQLGVLGILGALSICIAVEEQTGLRPRIKWPNDLYLEGRKFAGILCESSIQAGRLNYFILGFGVNVNLKSFPENLSETSTSLSIALRGERTDRVKLLQNIMERLEDYYFKLLTDGFSFFLPRVQVRDYLRDRTVKVSVGEGEIVDGVARGIDENGALLLETPESSNLRAVSQGRVLEC
jgi:BirA family transcriptional regulator, biotin operon repressor / biotin---[acetyl-CoA-carboxylase] ligase